MLWHNSKLLVVTRRDLSEGQQAVQSAHAVAHFCFEHPVLAKEWYTVSKYLALVSVSCEADLMKLVEKCKRKGLLITEVREPDIADALTAIAIEPTDQGRKMVANYPLTLKKTENESI